MKQASIKKLIAIYDAIGGLASEIGDPFDGMYKGGTDKLLADFTSVLEDCGVKFAQDDPGVYFVVSYIGFKGKDWESLGVQPRKQWGICTDKNNPDQSWCLTGFATPEDAIKTINDPEIFDDYSGGKIEIIDAAA